MRSLARRIEKLEQKRFAPEVQERIRELLAQMEAGRRRVALHAPPRGLRFRVPPGKLPEEPTLRRFSMTLDLGRELAWRESLYADCLLALQEGNSGSGAHVDYAGVESSCRQHGFPSISAFVENCREEGWIPGDLS